MMKPGNIKIFIALFVTGIVISVSSGQEWIHGGPNGGFITAITIAPSDTSVMYAGVESGFVYFSDDAGLSWTPGNNGLPLDSIENEREYIICALACHPINSEVVWASAGNNLYKSTDNAESWVQVNGGWQDYPWVTSIWIHPEHPDTMIAAAGGLFRSINGGEDWNLLENVYHGENVQFSCITNDPQNPDHLYASGPGLFDSYDGGANWHTINDNGMFFTFLNVFVDPENNNFIWIRIGDPSGLVLLYYSDNGGDSLHRIANMYRFYNVKELNIDSEGTVYLHLPSQALKSSDYATTWDTIFAGIPGDAWEENWSQFEINPENPETVFLGTQFGLFRSTDQGQTFEDRDYGISHATIKDFAIHPNEQEVIYACGDYGFWASDDCGESWQRKTFEIYRKVFVHPTRPDTLYAFRIPLCQSIDGGETWTTILNIHISAMAVDPFNPDVILCASSSRYQVPTIYRSGDAGQNWESWQANVNEIASIRCIAFDPQIQGKIYMTYQGLLISEDNGESWTHILNDHFFVSVSFHEETGEVLAVADNAIFVCEPDVGDFELVNHIADSMIVYNGLFSPIEGWTALVATNYGLLMISPDSSAFLDIPFERALIKIAYSPDTDMLHLLSNLEGGIWSINVTELTVSEDKNRSAAKPESFEIIAYPNPFNSSIMVSIESVLSDYVDIYIVDILGRKVINIYSGILFDGNNRFSLDFCDSESVIANGIYFIVVDRKHRTDVKKIVLLR